MILVTLFMTKNKKEEENGLFFSFSLYCFLDYFWLAIVFEKLLGRQVNLLHDCIVIVNFF